ncbi:hypothetical protein [Lacticaseibacillus daqingensis]|uniref:hypothetical protein n=1 Tax=Lacticaseibacillus daqingensis TaxID=2486014 RepID=UPI000F7ABA63|nr:hypothetical protein [Lacticaseibacillus daqingensis]
MTEKNTDLFLQKNAREKLALYQTIIQFRQRELPVAEQIAQTRTHRQAIDEVNLRRVAMLMNRNYGTLYYIYNQLLDELTALVDQPTPTVTQLFNIPVGRLRMALVEQGVPFR